MKTRQFLARILVLLISLPMALSSCTVDEGIAGKKKKIVIIVSKDSPGNTSHNWSEGSELLAFILNDESGLNVEAKVYKIWPKDEATAFKDVDTVCFLSDGGRGHPTMKHLDSFNKLMKSGVGLVCIHYAVEIPKGNAGNMMKDWIGGYFETHWSVNPHWTADFKTIGKHPTANGVKPFKMNDEWYYHMRFQDNMKGVTPVLSALPPADTLKRKDGPASNNPHVRDAVLKRKEKQHVGWAYDRPDGGRGFGTTGAHYHRAWNELNFTRMVLNAIVWTAKAEVPADGVRVLGDPVNRYKDFRNKQKK